MDTAKIVKEIILKHVPADELTDDQHIVDDLGADSLAVIAIAGTLEDEFDIAINDEEMNTAQTVSAAVALVEGKL